MRLYTVKPLRRNNLSTKDTLHIPNNVLPYEANTFSTSEKRIASLNGCPLLRGSNSYAH